MSIFSANDNFSIFALLMIAVVLGIVGEHKGWFSIVPGVLITILVAAIFTSLKILPSGSDTNISVPVYDFAFTYLIPLSIPLLLFNVQLKRVFQESGRLMIVFLIGSGSIFLGALIAAYSLDLGEESYKLAAVYTATYTGGSVNFMAVASTFNFLESPLFAASIVVDNVFTILFLMLLFLLPKLKFLRKYFPEADRDEEGITESIPVMGESLLITLSKALVISSILVALGMLVAPFLENLLQTEIKLDVLLITIFILIAANIFPVYLRQLEQVAFQFGMLLLYFFLAVIGATCDIGALLSSSPKVLVFAVIILFFHLGVTLFFGKLFKFSLEEIAIASGANIGGVSIAAPMAATFEMKKAVTPAILIGIMGYVIGTFLGIMVGLILK
jgi:uncharacterized membrane protein